LNDGDFSHVQPVIDRLPDSLTEDQRQQAIALIKRNADVFSRSEYDVGCAVGFTARINTGSSPPIAEPLRRQARIHLDEIDATIENMKQAGIVEDCCSPWSANLVVVARKDEQGNPVKPRITIDFRGLNSITTLDQFPLPRIKDVLQSLEGATIFCVCDMSNSFFQVNVHPADRDKSAFRTRKGQFRLTRLGQGLTNSPAIFFCLMSFVLRSLTCTLAYIDDTLCFSPSFERHLVDLESVLDRFRRANLKLKPTKCKFFQGRIRFVGHYVSAEGIEVDSAKTACVANWPCPRSISELRGFLGITGYFRIFIPRYAAIADPLTECLRKGVPLTCTPERQRAFDELKKMLISPPILAVLLMTQIAHTSLIVMRMRIRRPHAYNNGKAVSSE